MRPPRVVARAALIAVLASVAVSGSAGSRNLPRETPIDPGRFSTVDLQSPGGAATTILPPTLDPASDAATPLAVQPGDGIVEPAFPTPTGGPPPNAAPAPSPLVVSLDPWHHDPEESWYGPGLYGQRTACGEALTATLLGVASRTLPCGTLVSFRNPSDGKVVTVPVVDRGPYVAGRQWDLTAAACAAIDHCWTGPLEWRFP